MSVPGDAVLGARKRCCLTNACQKPRYAAAVKSPCCRPEARHRAPIPQRSASGQQSENAMETSFSGSPLLGPAIQRHTAVSPAWSADSARGAVLWVGLTFLTAALGGMASARAAQFYGALRLPEWAPPASVFGPVWSVLYVLMAVAAWLVWRHRHTVQGSSGLLLYGSVGVDRHRCAVAAGGAHGARFLVCAPGFWPADGAAVALGVVCWCAQRGALADQPFALGLSASRCQHRLTPPPLSLCARVGGP